ncbi:hypothetical protein CLPUN_32660 [Clostridium puniceum]|uniref:Uncharacterized protein n=1 Tax=Clostridium puniceum TaxID=29367 RepID=A0A1S8TDF8_9CLOT|nr:hypothetical protein CLPUN_32660 [Clostridium puniceum]
MQEQIIEMVKGINNPKILKLIYMYVKVAKKKADTK